MLARDFFTTGLHELNPERDLPRAAARRQGKMGMFQDVINPDEIGDDDPRQALRQETERQLRRLH